jgi:hypothetical protein
VQSVGPHGRPLLAMREHTLMQVAPPDAAVVSLPARPPQAAMRVSGNAQKKTIPFLTRSSRAMTHLE